MMNKKIYLLAALMLMLGLGLWLTGCESDTVAPHDETPELTSEDVAYQSAAMGVATSQVLPQLVEYEDNDKNEYSYTFPAGSDVTGTVHFDFRNGGPTGDPAPYDTATWGRLYTLSGETVSVEIGYGGSIDLEFDITATLSQDPDSATCSGGGTFTSGDYSATFTFDALVVVEGASYPTGGSMTFVSGEYTMTVTFDGSSVAVISYNGENMWNINLVDGSISDYDR